MAYSDTTRRITFDAPKELKDKVYSFIPPGLFSEIARNLFLALIKLQEEVGSRDLLQALLNKRIKIIIVSAVSRDTEEIKNIGEESP